MFSDQTYVVRVEIYFARTALLKLQKPSQSATPYPTIQSPIATLKLAVTCFRLVSRHTTFGHAVGLKFSLVSLGSDAGIFVRQGSPLDRTARDV